MKRVTIIVALALAAGAVGWDAVEFAGGYNLSPLAVPPLIPVSCLLLGLTALATCVAVTVTFIALFRRRIIYAASLVFTIAACWLISPWFAGRPAFLLGFAARLHQLSTPAEIQSVAQTCLSLMPSGGTVYGPRKGLNPSPEEAEQSTQLWRDISTHSFVRLDGDTCAIFIQPPEVRFTWGGALPGHWGILVGGPPHSGPYFDRQTIRFADGIVLFRGD